MIRTGSLSGCWTGPTGRDSSCSVLCRLLRALAFDGVGRLSFMIKLFRS